MSRVFSGPDYMVNFSPGWNFAPPTGLKYCCDYMVNYSPGAKRKFPWESLLRCENTIDTHARPPFSARAEKRIAITWIFQPGLNCGFSKDLLQKPGWNFSPRWNSPCNQALSCFWESNETLLGVASVISRPATCQLSIAGEHIYLCVSMEVVLSWKLLFSTRAWHSIRFPTQAPLYALFVPVLIGLCSYENALVIWRHSR